MRLKYLNRQNTILIREFNEKHKSKVLKKEQNFTISYEIELESFSEHTNLYDMLHEFKNIYEPLINKWDLDVDYDNSLIGDDSPIEGPIDDYDYDLEQHGTTYFKGVEIAPFTYFKGIKKSFHFLTEFFSYYNKQKQFYFSEKTGLHINIGYDIGTKNNWNILKGYLLLNEDEMTYRGFADRKNNEFSASYKKEFKTRVKSYLDRKYGNGKSSKNYIRDINQIIKDLNNILLNIIEDLGEKYIGFNVSKVKNNNYIEFRYPGGVISQSDIEYQTLHYANIVLACVDDNYRGKQFYNKLLNLLNNLS